MSVFRWGHPWFDFQDFERQVDQLLQRVNLSFHSHHSQRQRQNFPPLNLYELEDEFVMTVELPGIRTEDLEVTVKSGVLTLQGSRQSPEGISDDRYRRHERFRGSWQRSITLPDRIHEEGLSAEFQQGVLTVHLPKVQDVPRKTITVTEGVE